MLKSTPTPRSAAQQQSGTALRKPASSRPPASSSRSLPASAVSATPSEQRKPSLKAPSSSATAPNVKRSAGTPAGTARALPSTSAAVGTTRKASGGSAVGGAVGSEAAEGRRARRVSATEQGQAASSSAHGALSRSIKSVPSTSRLLPPRPLATSSKRPLPATTPTKRRAGSDSSSKADSGANPAVSETARARRAAEAASVIDSVTTPRTLRTKRSLGASDAAPCTASTATKTVSSLSSIDKDAPSRPAALPPTAPPTRKASRPSLTSSASRPLRTPLKSSNSPAPYSTLNMSTSARAPPLKRSSSIPIAASGSTKMSKTSSAISSHSIEEQEDKTQRGNLRSESVTSSTGMVEPGQTASSASSRGPNANRSPTRLPTKKVEGTRIPSPTRTVGRIEDRPASPPVFDLAASQSERRNSWETLPPSARPSLSGTAVLSTRLDVSQGPVISLSRPVGDSYSSVDNFEGDVSWETVESRRASTVNQASTFSLDSFQTPRKPLPPADYTSTISLPPAAEAEATTTSTLPTRANMSYVSPEASTLYSALSAHQLSLIHSSTSPSSTPQHPQADRAPHPRLASLSPPELTSRNRGRESSSIEELLKMSLMSAKKAGGDGGDEDWLYEEGTSRVMKADLDGVGTPWRRSVVVREQDGDEETWREEAEEARERIELLERELRLRAVQMVEEKAQVEEDRQAWRMEIEQLTQSKLKMEGEAESVASVHREERRRWEQELESRSTRKSSPSKEENLELQLAFHQATASHAHLITLADGLSTRAKAEREECSGLLASLRLVAVGLQVWEEAVSE